MYRMDIFFKLNGPFDKLKARCRWICILFLKLYKYLRWSCLKFYFDILFRTIGDCGSMNRRAVLLFVCCIYCIASTRADVKTPTALASSANAGKFVGWGGSIF